MALFSECRAQCAQTVLDTADIVRDGDVTPTNGASSSQVSKFRFAHPSHVDVDIAFLDELGGKRLEICQGFRRCSGHKRIPCLIALAVYALEVRQALYRAVLRKPKFGSENRITVRAEPFDRACRECRPPGRFVKGDEGG